MATFPEEAPIHRASTVRWVDFAPHRDVEERYVHHAISDFHPFGTFCSVTLD